MRRPLEDWVRRGYLRPHEPSAQEIRDRLAIVVRDLSDATAALSTDWQFAIAYNAALTLCSVVLHASGYRAVGAGHHYRTIQSLGRIFGSSHEDLVAFLDTCRRKRNTVEYDTVGTTTEADIEELLAVSHSLLEEVKAWLDQNHPDLV